MTYRGLVLSKGDLPGIVFVCGVGEVLQGLVHNEMCGLKHSNK